MLSDNEIGVFICHKDKHLPSMIDADELKKVARSFPQVRLVEDLYRDQWESSASQLSQALSQKGLSHLIIASCHSSNYENTFRKELDKIGLSPDQITLLNVLPDYLGVQVDPEVVRERSALLLKQALQHQQIAETHSLEPLETVPRILIIGGDSTALMCAREALNLGYEVFVLTSGKETARGGYHSGSQAEKDEEEWNALSHRPRSGVIRNGRLLSLSGKAGNFQAVFQDEEGRSCSLSVGAVMVALPPQEDPLFSPYGLEPGRQILSLSQLETLLGSSAYKEKILPESQSREVAFLLGLSGESTPGVLRRVLKNARRLQALEGLQVYLFTGNMKVADEGLERAFTQAREEGIVFFRFDRTHPRFQGTNALEIAFEDEILARPLTLRPHLLIVDENLKPHPELKDLAKTLGISLDGAGFIAPDQVYALPVRTPRKGIFAIGGSRRPVSDGEDSFSEAREALLLAAELIGPGLREVEPPQVEIDRKKCTICLTCVRSCPHQALSFQYRRPQVSALACQVCGICAAECPMDAIQIKNYRDQTLTAEVSTFFSARKYDTMAPQVVVFCCRNSAEKTVQQALLYKEPLPIGFEFIQVPCAGKIDPDYLLHALQQGADGVLILACHLEGCQSFEGNKLALERVRYLQGVITETGLEAERIQFQSIAPGMVAQFLKICVQMEDRFRKLGISPVRRSLGIQRIYEKFTFPVDSKTFVVI